MAATTDLDLHIEGMHCAGCVRSVEDAISGMSGVDQCAVNLATRSARIVYDAASQNEEQIIQEINRLGYRAKLGQPDVLEENRREKLSALRSFLTSLVLSVPLVVVAMWPMFTGRWLVSVTVDALAQACLSGLVLVLPGRSIIADALRQARHFRANMSTLIAMGVLSAWGWSVYALSSIYGGGAEDLYFESAGMIITLVLLGRYIEARARGRAGQAIHALMKLRPNLATALIKGVETEIEAAAVQPGMLLLVRPGERVPADGHITEGNPVIDESMVTGESAPVDKRVSDTVIGGSLNGNSPFQMSVSASSEESYLASIVRMVTEAQAKKAPVQRLADRVAGVFVPIVIGLAALTLVIWYWLAPDSPMLVRSVISVLIIACPCALGLATPTAVLVGTGRAAREGILIRGGDVLERLVSVDTVIFDKTGTLTHGELAVTSVMTFGHISEQNLLRAVGSLEAQSEHPVARAIHSHMRLSQVEPAIVRDVESRPGFGVMGQLDGRRLMVGNRAFMESESISFGQSFLKGDQEMEKGQTVVYAAMDGQVVGILSLSDRLRGDAREVISSLQESGRTVAMLTGDNRRTAAGVAGQLGVDNYEAEVLPEQKRLIVESYRRAGYMVAMVGDGINDGPSLAEANVAVAIGSGTEVAIETADVILSRSELSVILRLFSLSEKCLRLIKQNLFWAFFYNVLAIPIAAGLLWPVLGLTLSPVIAAAAMSLSSILVVSNSLRLYRVDL